MSKSKKKKPQKQLFLTTENQIRQKSRNLPIVKCSVNKGWGDEGLASILIVRQHSSGKFTFCCFLVDTNCLGVKDTMYWFNEPQKVLDEYEGKITASYESEEISYDLAHNIIFSAIKFAEKYGFKPHRNFISVTQYFLEEDNDNIPTIDIHCGNKNGEPVYINNGYETPELQQRIIKQLEKTAGKGNYEIYINASDSRLKEHYLDEDEFEDDDDDDDEIYRRWYYKFSGMGEDEFVQTAYNSLSKWIELSETGNYEEYENKELFEKVRALTDIWYENNMYNHHRIQNYYRRITGDLANIDTVHSENVPNSLFPTFVRNGEELADDFLETFFEINTNQKKKEVQKSIAKFALKYGDCEAVAYFKLIFNDKSKTDKWNEIEKELERFPDYFILKLLQKELETAEMPSEQARKELLNLVKGRTLTTFELSQFLTNYVIRVFEITNPETPDLLDKLESLEMLLASNFAKNKCGYTGKVLLSMVRIMKIQNIVGHLVHDTDEN